MDQPRVPGGLQRHVHGSEFIRHHVQHHALVAYLPRGQAVAHVAERHGQGEVAVRVRARARLDRPLQVGAHGRTVRLDQRVHQRLALGIADTAGNSCALRVCAVGRGGLLRALPPIPLSHREGHGQADGEGHAEESASEGQACEAANAVAPGRKDRLDPFEECALREQKAGRQLRAESTAREFLRQAREHPGIRSGLSQCVHHRVVARGFGKVRRLPAREPHERVEKEDRPDQRGESQDQRISSSDMRQFVDGDGTDLCLRQTVGKPEREKHGGAKGANGQWRVNVRAPKDPQAASEGEPLPRPFERSLHTRIVHGPASPHPRRDAQPSGPDQCQESPRAQCVRQEPERPGVVQKVEGRARLLWLHLDRHGPGRRDRRSDVLDKDRLNWRHRRRHAGRRVGGHHGYLRLRRPDL